nr:immunoglobulin heavy chain junction region [Macaca mulatta]
CAKDYWGDWNWYFDFR